MRHTFILKRERGWWVWRVMIFTECVASGRAHSREQAMRDRAACPRSTFVEWRPPKPRRKRLTT